MGSSEINKVEYRQGFAFVGIMGEHKANERRALQTIDEVTVT